MANCLRHICLVCNNAKALPEVSEGCSCCAPREACEALMQRSAEGDLQLPEMGQAGAQASTG